MEGLCAHFGECGGCDMQDIDYSSQLAMKAQALKESLSGLDIGHLSDIVPSPEIWHYRNKMEYIVGPGGSQAVHAPEAQFVGHSMCRRHIMDGNFREISSPIGEMPRPIIGLRRKKKFYRIVDLKECRIFCSAVEDIFAAVKGWISDEGVAPFDLFKHTGLLRYVGLRHSKHYDHIMATIVLFVQPAEFDIHRAKLDRLSERLMRLGRIKSVYTCLNSGVADVSMTGDIRLLRGEGHLRERINGIDYLIDPLVFFQTNSSCCSKLYDVIKDEALDGAGGVSAGTLLDLYCGSGGITLQMAGSFEKVTGIDIFEKNIDHAGNNAALNGIGNAEFVSEDVEKFLARSDIRQALSRASTMIIDPPRSGLAKKVRAALLDAGARKIIYVSCNPKNMSQDLSELSGKYKIAKVTPVDMFPHTRHLEAVVTLKRY